MTPHEFYKIKSDELQNVYDNLSQSIDSISWLTGHENESSGGDSSELISILERTEALARDVDSLIEAVNVLRDASE